MNNLSELIQSIIKQHDANLTFKCWMDDARTRGERYVNYFYIVRHATLRNIVEGKIRYDEDVFKNGIDEEIVCDVGSRELLSRIVNQWLPIYQRQII